MSAVVGEQEGMRTFRLFAIFVLVVLADQMTKLAALRHLSEFTSKEILPGIFSLTLVFNPGAAFGFLAGLPDGTRRIALAGVTVVALLLVLRLLRVDAKDDRVAQLALVGILGGAIGNLIDRFRFDAVIDFLDFYIGNAHWPAFNIADSVISLGVCVLALRFAFPCKLKSGAIGEGKVETST